MRPFRLKSAGHYVTVHIFDDLTKMYRWQKAYCRKTGHPTEADDGRAIGLFMGYQRINFKGGKENRLPDLGKVLLCRGKMPHAVVTHEVLHAAMHFDRIVHGNVSATFGKHVGDREERMAHTMSELLSQFYDRVTITEAR